jgi:hypothetical protein
MNVTFEITWPASLPPLETLVGDALRESVAWMRAPHGAPAAIFGAETFGLSAMERFERTVREWQSAPLRDDAALLWIAIEKGGTGGGFFRRLYRDFLAEARALRPSPALATAHLHYAALADDWTALGTQCGTGSLGDSLQRLTTLIQREREGVALLERAAH